ncbi:MAG: SURF1 family protein [Propionivibrio sp.]
MSERLRARSFRPSLWPTFAAALCIPLFLAAGQWQWNKAALKAERQLQRDTRSAQPALAMPATPADAATLADRRFFAEGGYEPQFQILIDNRTYNEQAGYHVVTPLRIAGSDVRLLVNRGWIAAPAERQVVPSFATPAGRVRVDGVAVVPPARFFSLGSPSETGPAWQTVWQNLDLERYRAAVDFPVQPVVLQLDPAASARDAGGGFVREWSRPDDKRLINVGYALQWWTFAATAFALWVVLGFRRRPAQPPAE